MLSSELDFPGGVAVGVSLTCTGEQLLRWEQSKAVGRVRAVFLTTDDKDFSITSSSVDHEVE